MLMTPEQKLWWNQAQSDYAVFVQLCGLPVNTCHRLHYLQMTTEKLCKAYLWRSGEVPSKTHTGFGQFLKALLVRKSADLDLIAKVTGFQRKEDLYNWVRYIHPLAHTLQKISPAEAGDGPNAEYPWPHAAPTNCPVDYPFPLWNELSNTAQGRKLLHFVGRAIKHFEAYA